MKCIDCGFTGQDAVFCPDCGSSNVTTKDDNAVAQTETPETPDEIVVKASGDMPNVEITVDVQGPVIAKITLPGKVVHELREGESITIASERTAENVTIRTPDSEYPGISSTPLKVFVQGGKVYATGGGDGIKFKVVTEVRHDSSEIVEINPGQKIGLGNKFAMKVS